MQLIKLTIENFKGISKFEIGPNGKDINIFGDNGTGKTTVIDAFMWLLFDKDSADTKGFHVKPLDIAGNVLNNGAESVVTALIEHNGELTEYKKAYKEKWAKKRGSSNPEFEGNITSCYIDNLAVSKTEFEKQINALCDKEVFKMVTSPLYFSENMKWTDRRNILFEICGSEIKEEDIINNTPTYSSLAEKGKHSVSDYKKICATKRVSLNKQLEEIPIRISELNNNILEVNVNVDFEKAQIKVLQDKKAITETTLQQALHGQHINALENNIQELKNELTKLNNENEIYKQQALVDFNNKQFDLIGKEKEELQKFRNAKYNVEREIKDTEYLLEKGNKLRENLLNEYREVSAMEWSGNETCPTCKQTLPVEDIEKAKEEFNNNKALQVETNIVEGKKIKQELEQLQVKLDEKMAELEVIVKCINHLETTIEKNNISEFNPIDKEDYKEKKAELETKIASLNKELENNLNNSIETKTKYMQEIVTLQNQITDHERNIIKVEQLESTKSRIKELEEERVAVASEVEKLDGIIFLCDEFIKHKISLVEESINSKFKIAKFKLFETQINGGIKEVCEVTYNGIPFSTNLNSAAKINVGIDIINTLTEHYKFVAPIFIDNAESVTKLEDTNSQVIRLVVSEENKQLLIETA